MKKVCRECNNILKGEFVEYEGEYICQDCFDIYYSYCDDCREIHLKDEMYWVEDAERLVCQDCADNNYYRCNDCGNLVSSYVSINDGTGSYYEVCDCCFNRSYYYYCDNCHDYFYEDNCHWDNDYCYCDNCYEDNGGEVYDYHEFDDWELFKSSSEEEPKYYIGKEIELEPKGSSNVHGVVNAINDNINAVPMHDSSLSYGGVEVVTHPESPKYLEEHKQDYINFFNEINNINYGNNGGCGLHFHVTRPNDNVIARVIILLESFKKEIKKLSRRSDGQLSSWAKFLTDYDSEESLKYQSSKYLKDTYVNQYHDRYYALNLCNSRTIEFRFFNGVNTFEQFWGALQFIENVMDIALDEDRDINLVNWQDLLKGDELREQASKRDVLSIDKKAKDTTDILEQLEKEREELKKKIKNTLNNMIKYIYKQLEDEKLEKLQRKEINNIYSTANTYLDKMQRKMYKLNDTVSFYNCVNDYSIRRIKENINFLLSSRNTEYRRYYKQIEKLINDFEKEAR